MVRRLNSHHFQNRSIPFWLLILAFLSACQTTSEKPDLETPVASPVPKIRFVQAGVSDFDLEWQIRGFQDLNPSELDEMRASSRNGVVTIKGQFKDPWIKRLFVKSIQRIPGVKSIHDETTFSAPPQISQQQKMTSSSNQIFNWKQFRLPGILLALFIFVVVFLRLKKTSLLKPLRGSER